VDVSTCREHTHEVAEVEVTRHLKEYFPQLGATPLRMSAASVAELVRAIDAEAPGFAFYVCDELGRLRQHVNVFVNEEMIVDRQRLSDRLDRDSRVFIAQALSGG
jgi:hypothetical protein